MICGGGWGEFRYSCPSAHRTAAARSLSEPTVYIERWGRPATMPVSKRARRTFQSPHPAGRHSSWAADTKGMSARKAAPPSHTIRVGFALRIMSCQTERPKAVDLPCSRSSAQLRDLNGTRLPASTASASTPVRSNSWRIVFCRFAPPGALDFQRSVTKALPDKGAIRPCSGTSLSPPGFRPMNATLAPSRTPRGE